MATYTETSTRANLASLDPVSGTLTMPSAYAIAGLVRHLQLLKDSLQIDQELQQLALKQLRLQEEYINNLLGFWVPILEDYEAQAKGKIDKSETN